MKQYRRKVPLFPLRKLFIIALIFVIISMLCFITSGEYGAICIIFTGIATALLGTILFAMLGAGGQYRYSENGVEVSFGPFIRKKILYGDIYGVVISNASYNGGRSDQMCFDMPMQYTVKTNNGKIKLQFPFISLLKSHYPLKQIKTGMSSRDLAVIESDKIYCLGICWPGALDELMKHTDMPVYVLEDVYLRFKGLFDATFAACAKKDRHLFIVTNQVIPYEKYLGS